MLYEPIELGLTGTPACPDTFTPASTLLCPGCVRLLLTVELHPAFVQLGNFPAGQAGSNLGAVQWQGEWTAVAGIVASLGRRFDAIRVRNRYAGEPARVIVVCD